jgi:hypothetical protein
MVGSHLLDRARRQRAVDDTDVDAGLFEDPPVLENAAQALAALFAEPLVAQKALSGQMTIVDVVGSLEALEFVGYASL